MPMNEELQTALQNLIESGRNAPIAKAFEFLCRRMNDLCQQGIEAGYWTDTECCTFLKHWFSLSREQQEILVQSLEGYEPEIETAEDEINGELLQALYIMIKYREKLLNSFVG